MIQYIDRGLRFYDKVTDQCSHRHQYPPVGSGCHDLTKVITGRHKAHICAGQEQYQTDISIHQADQDLRQCLPRSRRANIWNRPKNNTIGSNESAISFI